MAIAKRVRSRWEEEGGADRLALSRLRHCLHCSIFKADWPSLANMERAERRKRKEMLKPRMRRRDSSLWFRQSNRIQSSMMKGGMRHILSQSR